MPIRTILLPDAVATSGSVLRTRTPWVSQPQIAGVGIDWSNPLTKGLLFAYNPGASGSIYDHVTGKSFSPAGGASVAPTGKIRTFNGSQQTNGAISLPTEGRGYLVCARVIATGSQAGNPGAAFGIYKSVDQSGFGVGFNSSNQVGFAQLTTSGAGLSVYSASSIGVWYDVYAYFSMSGAAHAWINGLPASTNQGVSVSNYSLGQNEFAIGAQHRSSGFLRNFTGNLAYATVHYLPNGFTDADALRMYQGGYPYNIFQPLSRSIVIEGTSSTVTDYPSNAEPGSISVTGSAATGVRTLLSTTATGSLSLTGSAATSSISKLSNATAGQIVLTGSAATSLKQYKSPTATGAISLTGYAATSFETAAGATVSQASPGSYDILGYAPVGQRHLLSSTGVGSISLTGSAATSSRSISSATAAGSITLTGQDATALRTYVSGAAPAQIYLTGYDTTDTSALQPIARPTTDTSAGSWLPSTGSDLYAMLDEAAPDANDYIYANSATTCELALNAVADPGTTSGQVVSYTAWSPSGNGLVVRLIQKGSPDILIREWTHAAGVLPLTTYQFNQSLSAAECNAITDYAALSISFEST